MKGLLRVPGWPTIVPFTILTLAPMAPWEVPAAHAQVPPYCQQSSQEMAQKDILRQKAATGDRKAQAEYDRLVAQHAQKLQACRSQTWPKNQAIWVRLYPCDVQPGMLDKVLDRIVNRGYNQVYVNTFYTSKVLLPTNDNPTIWPSVMAGTSGEKRDLLAEVIRKGRDRGLKVYAWLFAMNFGKQYFQRGDRAITMAKNGLGQTSLNTNPAANISPDGSLSVSEEAFIDPYSSQARADYIRMVQAVTRRKPDGVLFDYIRYPRGSGAAAIARRVQDLWIYGDASRQVLSRRAQNSKGRELIDRYLAQGGITAQDIRQVETLFPGEGEPLWQGRSRSVAGLSAEQQAWVLQGDLWQLSVSHAAQGVIDFLNEASGPVQRSGIQAGAVFFPDGNQTTSQGYDSRLQFWDRFPSSLSFHPMAYGVCGTVNCITNQVQRVYQLAPRGARIEPVLAGIWQQPVTNRPPLEKQMQALRSLAPNLNTMSHFAYSWQEPGSDRDRKSCRP